MNAKNESMTLFEAMAELNDCKTSALLIAGLAINEKKQRIADLAGYMLKERLPRLEAFLNAIANQAQKQEQPANQATNPEPAQFPQLEPEQLTDQEIFEKNEL